MLIGGFIREYETRFIKKTNYNIVPTEIFKLLFIFYFIPFEMDTIILTEKEQEIFEGLLKQNKIETEQLHLLYRSSRDGLNGKTVINKCQNNTNILWWLYIIKMDKRLEI